MPKFTSMLSRSFNVQSTFFIPVWRRILVVAVSGGWALLEYINGAPYWSLMFAVIALYCAHQFFVVFDPSEKED